VEEYFLRDDLTLSAAASAAGITLASQSHATTLHYRPALLAQATVRFLERKYDLDHLLRRAALVTEIPEKGLLRWESFVTTPIEPEALDAAPVPGSRFGSLPPSLSQSQALKGARADYLDWVYHNTSLKIAANEALRLYAAPDITSAQFAERCRKAAEEAREADVDKTEAAFERKLDALEDKLARAQNRLEAEESEYSARKQEEIAKHAETIFGLFTRRRRTVSASLSKRRMTSQAKMDVEEAQKAIKELEADMAELQQEMEQALEEVEHKWEEVIADVTERSLTPAKKNVVSELFGIIWLPHYVVEDSQGKEQQLPAYKL
jgi:hypothetical protein